MNSTKTTNAFAFGRSDFGNHMASPLKLALLHHYFLLWSDQQGTKHYLQNHWQDELTSYLLVFLTALTDATTLQPAGRIKEYLATVVRVKQQDAGIRKTAKRHYGKAFLAQQAAIARKELPADAADSFWAMVHEEAKQALIDAKLAGRQYSFEQVFGPI